MMNHINSAMSNGTAHIDLFSKDTWCFILLKMNKNNIPELNPWSSHDTGVDHTSNSWAPPSLQSHYTNTPEAIIKVFGENKSGSERRNKFWSHVASSQSALPAGMWAIVMLGLSCSGRVSSSMARFLSSSSWKRQGQKINHCMCKKSRLQSNCCIWELQTQLLL